MHFQRDAVPPRPARALPWTRIARKSETTRPCGGHAFARLCGAAFSAFSGTLSRQRFQRDAVPQRPASALPWTRIARKSETTRPCGGHAFARWCGAAFSAFSGTLSRQRFQRDAVPQRPARALPWTRIARKSETTRPCGGHAFARWCGAAFSGFSGTLSRRRFQRDAVPQRPAWALPWTRIARKGETTSS